MNAKFICIYGGIIINILTIAMMILSAMNAGLYIDAIDATIYLISGAALVAIGFADKKH